MDIRPSLSRFDDFIVRGNSGQATDVDFLMDMLAHQDDLATSRLVDYALSLIVTRPGTARLVHYLFYGVPIQRNYAALYFKRRGHIDLLDEAVNQGRIDQVQAYAK